MAKALTVSIIIPVYNEAHRLASCLDAIAAQTEKPVEVIVADNNSTDQSVAIAERYKFVKVIHVKRQGQSYARSAAFEIAKGDILGRIDADAVIASDWVAQIKHNFTQHDIDAVTGLASSAVLPRLKWPKTVLWSWMYFLWMRGIFRLPVLWGANMAIRRSAWGKIAKLTVKDDKRYHEDQDLGICILESGGKVKVDNQLRMTTGGQTYHYFPKLLNYTIMTYRTKSLHSSRPEYKSLKKNPPLFVLAVLWIAPGMIILPLFFTVSFLLWPIDYLVAQLGHAKKWLD